jgi:hypothetical protein
MKKLLFVFVILSIVNVYAQDTKLDDKFSKLSIQTNILITKELIKENDGKNWEKIQNLNDIEKIRTIVPSTNKTIIDMISSFRDKFMDEINQYNSKIIIKEFIDTCVAIIPDGKDPTKRNKTKSLIVKELDSLKENFETNSKVEDHQTDSNKIYLDSLREIGGIDKLNEIQEITSWWEYKYWGLLIITILAIFIIYLIIRKIKTLENKLQNRIDLVKGLIVSQPYRDTKYLTKIDVSNEIDTRLIPILKDIEEIKQIAPKNSSTPAYFIPPVEEQIAEKQFYSESPEQEGWFLTRNLQSQMTPRSLYIISKDIDSNSWAYDILLDNIQAHRPAMNSTTPRLKPACEYSVDPEPLQTRILKNGSEKGVLEDIGNNKLKIIKKIKIRFL